MDIRGKILSWLMRGKYPTLDEVCFGDEPNPNSVTENNALTYTAFWAAVRRISCDIAKLPVQVFKVTPSGLEPQPLHPVSQLLRLRPNNSQTPYVFKETQQARALSWGNCYAEIVFRNDGRPAGLNPIAPSRVTANVQSDGSIVYTVKQPNNRTVEIPASKMIHVHGLGDGIQGYSPVQLFRQNLNLSLGAENAGAHFFGNMMRPGATLSHPAQLSDEAFARLTKSVKAQAGGATKTGGIMILEEGLSMDQWTIPPNDAQFLETRTFQVQDVARIFNIPPHKLAELSRATFSNVEEQERQYVGDCLQPWLENWEQELEYKLFLPEEQGEYQIRFNVDGLLRGNTQARAEFFSKMFNIGVLSINEIRTIENFSTIGPQGDEHYVPVNLQTAEKAAAGMPTEETETEIDEGIQDAENPKA